MKPFLKKLKDNAGATVIEYGILAISIAMGALLSMYLLGCQLNFTFLGVANTIR